MQWSDESTCLMKALNNPNEPTSVFLSQLLILLRFVRNQRLFIPLPLSEVAQAPGESTLEVVLQLHMEVLSKNGHP